jgi:cysteine-rich repeat protein
MAHTWARPAVAEEATCGNGVVEPGEQCDGGECCSWNCQFAAADSGCSDGNACNDPDACDGAGHCVGQPPLTICPGSECRDPVACDPQLGCLNPPKADGTPCDDGDVCSGDQCLGGVCIGNVPTCGDGIIQSSCEYCDDGNTQNRDGCNSACKMEWAGRMCQQAVGRVGRALLQRLQFIRRCRDNLNDSRPVYFDRERTQPLTNPADCPNEYRVTQRTALREGSVHRGLSWNCTDNLVRGLPLCATTVDGLVGCVVGSHIAAVDALIAQEYAVPLTGADAALRVCQYGVAKAAGNYVVRALQAIQMCRNRMDQGQALYFDMEKTQRLTDPADCAAWYVASTGITDAGKLARSTIADWHDGYPPRCTDELVANLGLCATTVDGLVSPDGTGGCLLAGHVAQAEDLIRVEYRAR